MMLLKSNWKTGLLLMLLGGVVVGLSACANPCAGRDNCTSVGHSTATEIIFVDEDTGEEVERWDRIGGMSPLQDGR